MLIKVGCMQKPHEFCHGFFQARFMSLLRIKLKQSSHNQICWCGKLGKRLEKAGPAFHGWWAMSPPVAWHYWCFVSSWGDRMRYIAESGLSHPWAAEPTHVFSGLKTVMLYLDICYKKCSGHWSCHTDMLGVCGKIFIILEVRMIFFYNCAQTTWEVSN